MAKEMSIFKMDKEEVLYYLRNDELNDELFHRADKIRKRYCGEEVHIRGIIEFSNYCCRNCLYCGLRRDNKKIKRYRMSEEEIISSGLKIASLGVKTIVLQSGDDFYYSRELICRIIEAIKKKADVAITLSIGERPFEDYRAFKESGADRYLLKHETINPKLYEFLHPGQNLKQRIKILEILKKIGYQIGAGNIVGLPFQSLEDLADDILFLKELDVDMAGIGPFIPQKNTPLGNNPQGNLKLTLKLLAITRILTKNTHLPATTALATLDPEKGQILALQAGCNVIMPNFTPEEYRSNYQIYDRKARVNLEKAKEVIHKAGRLVGQSRGDTLKFRQAI